MQRHDVASMLRRRCNNVLCPLGMFFFSSPLLSSLLCFLSSLYLTFMFSFLSLVNFYGFFPLLSSLSQSCWRFLSLSRSLSASCKQKNPYMSQHMKKETLWFFIYACTVPYLDDIHVFLPEASSRSLVYHYENMPIQIYWKFHHQKLKIFR